MKEYKIPFEQPIKNLAKRIRETAYLDVEDRFMLSEEFHEEVRLWDSAISNALERIAEETHWKNNFEQYLKTLPEVYDMLSVLKYSEKNEPEELKAHQLRNSLSFRLIVLNKFPNHHFIYFKEKVTPEIHLEVADILEKEIEKLRTHPFQSKKNIEMNNLPTDYNETYMSTEAYERVVRTIDEEYIKLKDLETEY